MLELIIPAMTCNHCVLTLTKAISEVDKNASLNFDLQAHRLKVDSDLKMEVIKDAIEKTGYRVESIEDAAPVHAANCCGSCSI